VAPLCKVPARSFKSRIGYATGKNLQVCKYDQNSNEERGSLQEAGSFKSCLLPCEREALTPKIKKRHSSAVPTDDSFLSLHDPDLLFFESLRCRMGL
jgi:hypothetical protein